MTRDILKLGRAIWLHRHHGPFTPSPRCGFLIETGSAKRETEVAKVRFRVEHKVCSDVLHRALTSLPTLLGLESSPAAVARPQVPPAVVLARVAGSANRE